MARIQGILGKGRFETIRDAIGAILVEEIANQISLLEALTTPTNDQLTDLKILQNTTVWRERMVPIQQDEAYIIIPLLFNADFQNQSVFQSDTSIEYYIDVYGKSKAEKDTGKRADRNSAERTSRLLSYIYFILQHPEYRTLGFENHTVQYIRARNFSSFRRSEVEENETSVGIVMYRGILTVDSLEENGETNPTQNITELFTSVEINETDRGFQFLTTL